MENIRNKKSITNLLDKLETVLFILGVVSVIGMIVGVFSGGMIYFTILWIFVISMFGLIFGNTISPLFIHSKDGFARLWGTIYLILFIIFTLLANGIILDIFKYIVLLLLLSLSMSVIEYYLSEKEDRLL